MKATDFRINDRVKLIDCPENRMFSHYTHLIGCVGTVVEIKESLLYVDFTHEDQSNSSLTRPNLNSNLSRVGLYPMRVMKCDPEPTLFVVHSIRKCIGPFQTIGDALDYGNMQIGAGYFSVQQITPPEATSK